MLRKLSVILFFALITVSTSAFDKETFVENLKDYAEAISQSAYLSEETHDEQAFEGAIERAEIANKRIESVLNDIKKPEDFKNIQKALASFADASEFNSHTVALVEKKLQQRISFLSVSDPKYKEVTMTRRGQVAANKNLLLNKRQRRFVTLKIPIIEAIVSFEDTDKNRRVDNFDSIMERHSCKVLAHHSQENGKKYTHSYYFSGRKFLIDALLDHFSGDIVESNLRAVVKMTTGGFWSGENSVEVEIEKKSDNSVMGELSWFKSVIERAPVKYLLENHYSSIKNLGKITDVAGKEKMQFKNTKIEIWVMANNGSKANAIHYTETDLGDIFEDAQ